MSHASLSQVEQKTIQEVQCFAFFAALDLKKSFLACQKPAEGRRTEGPEETTSGTGTVSSYNLTKSELSACPVTFVIADENCVFAMHI